MPSETTPNTCDLMVNGERCGLYRDAHAHDEGSPYYHHPFTMPQPEPPAPTPSATTCASCGKPLTRNWYMDDDWYCGIDGCPMQYKQQPVPPASAPAATPEPERWEAGQIPVLVWEPTGGVTRRGPEIAPDRTELEWAAWPSGDQSRAIFCKDEAEAHAIAASRSCARPTGEEAEPVTMRDVSRYASAYADYAHKSAGDLTGAPREAHERAYVALEARLIAQATELAALRARVERIEWAEKLCISVHHNFIPGDEAITATYHDVIRGEDVSANGPTWDAALAALRAALAPRQLTGDQP